MPADQLDPPALRLLAQRPELFARQGHVAAGWDTATAGSGPYYRLSYRLDGRSIPSISAVWANSSNVCQRLESLQHSLVERRAVRRLERQVRAASHPKAAFEHPAASLRPSLEGF